MRRLVLACLVWSGSLVLGCALPAAVPMEPTLPPAVNAGPPGCLGLVERLDGGRTSVAEAHWLDAPERMAEARRLRALEARAVDLGCAQPHG